MLKEILIFAIIVLSVPIGYLLAYMGRDELIDGRKWFKLLMILSVAGFILFILLQNYIISYTFVTIFIVSFVSLIKSKDKKWTKKRI